MIGRYSVVLDPEPVESPDLIVTCVEVEADALIAAAVPA